MDTSIWSNPCFKENTLEYFIFTHSTNFEIRQDLPNVCVASRKNKLPNPYVKNNVNPISYLQSAECKLTFKGPIWYQFSDLYCLILDSVGIASHN